MNGLNCYNNDNNSKVTEKVKINYFAIIGIFVGGFIMAIFVLNVM